MALTNKVSLSSIIYLASEDTISDRLFDTFLRYANRAIEQMGAYAILISRQEKETVRNGRIKIPLDEFYYLRSIAIDGIPVYLSDEKHSIQEAGVVGGKDYYTYTVENDTVILNKDARNGLEGKQAEMHYRVFDRNAEGDIMIPSTMQESIIAFIRKEEAYKVYHKSGGRAGRGLWQDMNRDWEIKKDEAMADVDSPSEDEIQLISLIWNTKHPLSATRSYKNFNKLH